MDPLLQEVTKHGIARSQLQRFVALLDLPHPDLWLVILDTLGFMSGVGLRLPQGFLLLSAPTRKPPPGEGARGVDAGVPGWFPRCRPLTGVRVIFRAPEALHS